MNFRKIIDSLHERYTEVDEDGLNLYQSKLLANPYVNVEYDILEEAIAIKSQIKFELSDYLYIYNVYGKSVTSHKEEIDVYINEYEMIPKLVNVEKSITNYIDLIDISNEEKIILKELTEKDKLDVLNDVIKSRFHYKTLSETEKNNKLITRVAVLVESDMMEYASDRLKDDKDFCLKVLDITPFAYKYFSDNVKSDKSIANIAICKEASNFEYVSKELHDDESLLKAAIETPMMLRYASDRLKDNKEITLNFVARFDHTIKYVSDRLKDDVEVVHAGLLSAKESLNTGVVQKNCSDRIKDMLNNHNIEEQISILEVEIKKEKLNDVLPIQKEIKSKSLKI